MICIWVCFAFQVVSYSLTEALPGITSVGRRGEGREGERDGRNRAYHTDFIFQSIEKESRTYCGIHLNKYSIAYIITLKCFGTRWERYSLMVIHRWLQVQY